MAQAGYRVTLIAPTDFEQQGRDGITVLGVRQPSSRYQRPLVWWRLYRIVRHLRPDVIHFHDPELLSLVPLFRITLGRNVKIIYDVHEYFVDSLAGKYWIPVRLRSFAISTAGWLEALLIRGVDGMIYVVKEQETLYENFRGLTTVVRNMPFTSLFEGAKPHPVLDVDGFKLIYVGLILPVRGINVLLTTMQILRQQGQRDVHLFLVGPETSPAYMQEFHTFVQNHQLADQVHWLGYVPHDQIKHYLTNAHVGMLPGLRTRQSRNPGIATKLLEYMLCGLPIISVDHPHHTIYIEECDCGLIVSPQDASAHAEAILWLRDHPDKARAMGQRGRDMVRDHYTWEREQSQLLTFYRALLQTELPA